MPPQVFNHKKRIYWLLLLLGIYCFLPFFILAFYAYPQADDYGFAVRDSQSGFWETQVNFYMYWSGRFFATAVAQFNPLIQSNFKIYPAFAISFLLVFSGSIYLVLFRVFRPALSKQITFALSAFVLALYLLQLPSPSEALFWFTGIAGYSLPNILFLLLLLCLYNSNRSASKIVKSFWTVTAAIAGALMAGSNEMALVLLMTTLLFILLVDWTSTSEIRLNVLAVFCFCLLISMVAVLAPGNFVRMDSHLQAKQPFWATAYAGVLTVASLYRWGGVLLIASLVYAYAFGGRIREAKGLAGLFKVPLILLAIYVIGTIFMMQFVYTWSTGERPTPRVENVIYFFLLLSWFYTLQVLMVQRPEWFDFDRLTFFIKLAALLLLLLAVLNLENNISTAYLDLLSGKAITYKEALQQRTDYLKESSCETCIVPALPAVPATLHFLDIQAKGNDELQWVNEDVAAYFQKRSVHLAEPNPLVQENYSTLVELAKIGRASSQE